jgi:hypothetical protein
MSLEDVYIQLTTGPDGDDQLRPADAKPDSGTREGVEDRNAASAEEADA